MQKVSIIGASGLVGLELSTLLPKAKRYAKKAREDTRGKLFGIDAFSPKDFDVVFLCTPAAVSTKIAAMCQSYPCKVIDLSSAFRNDPSVPLVIPEINGLELLEKHLIASPNCTTTILLMALYPLHKIAHLESIRVTTFQAASGGGVTMLNTLLEDTQKSIETSQGLAFATYPHESKKNTQGYCEEEVKMISETKKILKIDLPIRPFCVRVPTKRVHSLAIEARFATTIDPLHALWALNNMPGVIYSEDAVSNIAEKRTEVFCSNLRQDLYDPQTINLWAFGDQLLKGAAYNAFQIYEMLKNGLPSIHSGLTN